MRYVLTTAFLALAVASAQAHDDHKHNAGKGHDHDKTTQLGAHEHGSGKLNVAIEGKTVSIELEVPAYNIVGFEHAAETKAQKAALKDAMKKLAAPTKLFVVNAEAGCKRTASKIETVGAIGDDDHHGHSHGHDHGNKKKASGDAEETHSEFRATYTLTCAAPDKIEAITFGFFDTFKRSEELDVSVIGAKGQRTFEATPNAKVLSFKGII